MFVTMQCLVFDLEQRPRVVRGRRTPPAGDPLAGPAAAARVSVVWTGRPG